MVGFDRNARRETVPPHNRVDRTERRVRSIQSGVGALGGVHYCPTIDIFPNVLVTSEWQERG